MKILVITNTIPFPTLSGGALRNYNLLKRIAASHEVWLATNLENEQEEKGVPHLREFCKDVLTGVVRRKSKINHLAGLARYAMKGWPLELKFRDCPELASKIQAVCQRVPFDIIQIEESRMALYLEYLPHDLKAKKVLTFYDIAFAQSSRFTPLERSLVARWRSQFYSQQMRGWEPEYTRHFDCGITVSENDREILLKEAPGLRLEVIPNGVDTKTLLPIPTQPTHPTLLFIGNMSYLPCVDGAIYLVKEVLPLLTQKLPDVEIWLVGADPTPEILGLNAQNVHVTGRVESVYPYYQRSTIAVVPIRAGGGTRLKILEAMALGRPVVSTTIGCEGLAVRNGEHLLVADRPEEFVEQITRLTTNPELYQHVVTNARKRVVDIYDWDQIARRLMSVYEKLVAK